MNEGKKYRSLDEIYLQESFAKKVPGVPGTRVIFVSEEADVVIQANPPAGDVKSFRVSDKVAKEIIGSINKHAPSKTEEGELTVSTIIDKVLTDDGWKAGNKDYPALLERVIGIFSRGELKPENFNNLLKIQKDKNNKFRTQLLASPGQVFDYQSLIPETFVDLFEGDNGIRVADELWSVTFKAKVNVGAGELAFTLLSDAVKGKVGDLFFEDIGEVEVKGLGARMGGDGYCHSHTPAELNKILSAEGENKLSEKTLLRIKADIYKKIENFIKSREALKGKVIVPKEQQVSFLTAVRDALDNADTVNELLKDIDNFGLPANIKTQLKQAVKDYSEHKAGKIKGLFSPAIKTFFSLVGELTDEQLAEGIVATRNYSAVAELSNLKNYVQGLIASSKTEFFTETGFTYNLYRLITAIHIALYQKIQKFNNILFLNDTTKKLVDFKFESNDLGQNITSVYNFLKKYNAAINMSVDDKFKSAGVSLEI
jgi:hypothetical protein